MKANKTTDFAPGDWVIYCKTKFSRQPGPRAQRIQPAPRGDGYVYLVDKFWIVDEVLPDGSLVLRTRRGKMHTVSPDDFCLRAANFWERMWHRDRFEEVEAGTDETVSSGGTLAGSA